MQETLHSTCRKHWIRVSGRLAGAIAFGSCGSCLLQPACWFAYFFCFPLGSGAEVRSPPAGGYVLGLWDYKPKAEGSKGRGQLGSHFPLLTYFRLSIPLVLSLSASSSKIIMLVSLSGNHVLTKLWQWRLPFSIKM